eukprot:4368527-Prymnesium_polylepis.1
MATVCASSLRAEAASPPAEALLAELAALPGVSSVNAKPVKPATKLNHFGVAFLFKVPGEGKAIAKRSAVTEEDGERPNFVAAVQWAIDWVTNEMKTHGVQVDAADGAKAFDLPTAEELEWLSEWIDEQPTPEAVTVAQADAALAARRSSRAGPSQAG